MPTDNNKPLIKRIALCGVMTALALVFGYIEHLVPFPIGIYGIKIGLANLVVVVMLYTMNWQSALIINLARIFISFLLFGSATSLIYSLCGGILSFLVMLLIKSIKKPSFSVIIIPSSLRAFICKSIGLFPSSHPPGVIWATVNSYPSSPASLCRVCGISCT